MQTFKDILNSIPLDFKLKAAKEFASLFSPEYQYGTADAHFFYTADQAMFEAYVVGKYKVEEVPNVVIVGDSVMTAVTQEHYKAIGMFKQAEHYVTNLKQITEPSKETNSACDSFNTLAARVTELEKDMDKAHSIIMQLRSKTITYG